MYARTTTITADPMRMDEGIADVRDNVMPAVGDMDGYTGLSMLCDRDSGRCIVTTGWQSEESIAASRDRVMRMRERAAEQFGARNTQVQEWEIAVVHRLHSATDDSCARVMWSRTDPDRVEETLAAFRSEIIPRMDDVPGFCSLSLLIDRQTGLGSLATVYADRAAMDATRDLISGMRDEFAPRMGVTVTEEAEFDVVLHSLRVPELV
jgi:heme-degrading monooxygenase HmoA/quinol monooxygenase YgiN